MFGAYGIALRTTIHIVLRTIQLNDQFGLCTVKVNDISPKRDLAAKLQWVGFQKTIPQVVFLPCGVFPEGL